MPKPQVQRERGEKKVTNIPSRKEFQNSITKASCYVAFNKVLSLLHICPWLLPTETQKILPYHMKLQN